MEANDLGGGGGLFSGMASSAMLGLDFPIQQHHHQQQKQQNPHHAAAFDPQLAGGAGYSFAPASKPPASEEDEEGVSGDGNGKSKISQWQRMKWTDTMVRLLIMAVFYIGDDTVPESGEKKKLVGSGSGGALQKKGKWKSVSRAMLEKGFYVSPQQCEDKFNDLNKRYKRVNDILGKGTACKVVENQTLLDSMELNPRTKQEVRKLLNSKHLFFREMCAYHNSCGHSNPSAGGAHTSPSGDPAPPLAHHHHPPHSKTKQQLCVHPKKIGSDDDELNGDENNESEEEEEDDVVEDHDEDEFEEEEDNYDEGRLRKKPKRRAGEAEEKNKGLVERLREEVMGVVGDGTRSVWEVKRWLRARAVELEEEGVGFQCEALELEKQRLKWAKFSSKKEREMERVRFENEKRRLENERMVLIVRQKELEILARNNNQQQHSCSNKRNGDPSSITG